MDKNENIILIVATVLKSEDDNWKEKEKTTKKRLNVDDSDSNDEILMWIGRLAGFFNKKPNLIKR